MNESILNHLASSIKSNEDYIGNLAFDDVRKYCVKTHNEAVEIMNSIMKFLEKNLDLFENGKGGWKFRNMDYYKDWQIGSSNPYNCVLRDCHHEETATFKSDDRIYFVDNGIIFSVLFGKVLAVTDMEEPTKHGYDKEARMWNNSRQSKTFNHIPTSFYHNNKPKRYSIPKWTLKDVPVLDEFKAESLKREVDNDLAHAKVVMEKLVFTLKAINDSVMSRVNKNNDIIDNVSKSDTMSRKVVKYRVEIIKIEE